MRIPLVLATLGALCLSATAAPQMGGDPKWGCPQGDEITIAGPASQSLTYRITVAANSKDMATAKAEYSTDTTTEGQTITTWTTVPGSLVEIPKGETRDVPVTPGDRVRVCDQPDNNASGGPNGTYTTV